jgi:hypothetical protein
MAVSTCVKCNGHSFEVVLFTPIGDSRKLFDRAMFELRDADWNDVPGDGASD